MSLEFINESYGTTYQKGSRVEFQGKPGVVVGFHGSHLKVKLDEEKSPGIFHPTWEMKEIKEEENENSV